MELAEGKRSLEPEHGVTGLARRGGHRSAGGNVVLCWPRIELTLFFVVVLGEGGEDGGEGTGWMSKGSGWLWVASYRQCGGELVRGSVTMGSDDDALGAAMGRPSRHRRRRVGG